MNMYIAGTTIVNGDTILSAVYTTNQISNSKNDFENDGKVTCLCSLVENPISLSIKPNDVCTEI